MFWSLNELLSICAWVSYWLCAVYRSLSTVPDCQLLSPPGSLHRCRQVASLPLVVWPEQLLNASAFSFASVACCALAWLWTMRHSARRLHPLSASLSQLGSMACSHCWSYLRCLSTPFSPSKQWSFQCAFALHHLVLDQKSASGNQPKDHRVMDRNQHQVDQPV